MSSCWTERSATWDITLHYITSHHITSHHITSHYITLHYITSHHITLHVLGAFSTRWPPTPHSPLKQTLLRNLGYTVDLQNCRNVWMGHWNIVHQSPINLIQRDNYYYLAVQETIKESHQRPLENKQMNETLTSQRISLIKLCIRDWLHACLGSSVGWAPAGLTYVFAKGVSDQVRDPLTPRNSLQ